MKTILFEDTPSDNPGMDFTKTAQVISKKIISSNAKKLTVGIFGGYGSGKTTLMNSISKELKVNNDVVVVNFEAWRYDKEDDLIKPFLANLLKNDDIQSKRPNLSKKAHAALRGMIRGISLKGAFFSFSADKAIAAEENYLETLEQKYLNDYINGYELINEITRHQNDENLKVVVIIDDLDRCIPAKAFSLIECLKSLLDIPGLFFILGIDPRVITTYLLSKYGQEFCVSPEDYLQKIFPISYYLPKPTSKDIYKEIKCILNKISDQEYDQSEVKWRNDIGQVLRISFNSETIPNIDNYNLIEYMPKNLRQVKRILNLHQILMSQRNDKFDSELLLVMLIIKMQWPIGYWGIFSIKTNFRTEISACQREVKDSILYKKVKNNMEVLSELLSDSFIQLYDNFIYNKQLHHHLDCYCEAIGWPIEIDAIMNNKE